MATARVAHFIPFDPTYQKYSTYKSLHQRLQRSILEYRGTPKNSLPPPQSTFLAYELAPTFLLGASAAKHDPADKEGWFAALVKSIRTDPWERTGDFFNKDNPYRLSNKQSAILTRGLDIYSLRALEHEAADDKNPWRDVAKFTCGAEVMQRLDRNLSTYVGPGQVIVQPVIDLRPTRFAGCTKNDIERVMGLATERMLRDQLFIEDATYKPGSGIWVQSRFFGEPRQIADVHVTVEDDILSFGVILNVENPVGGDSDFNPWSRMEEADIEFNPFTSLLVEAGIPGYRYVLGHIKGVCPMRDSMVLLVSSLLNAFDIPLGNVEVFRPEMIVRPEMSGDMWLSHAIGYTEGGWG
ncbi:hypothetical protein F4821DRAFT_52967 [Hypoxylon rubiginosum]|uniref:Uncharacterized protein n=1 Tax=Hypoxylon rubiginosum TaxID=110542 RepID=A0ACC0DAP9_9PEZI|nr:hypothetical protein F4821DRAFT_52967 [Hypoxylon rubiginosum]